MSGTPEDIKKLDELEEKVHELRMDKLIQYKHIAEEMEKTDNEIKEIMQELKDTQAKLVDCTKEEEDRIQTEIKIILAKIKLLDSRKTLFAQLRLLCRNIQHEINMVLALKYKAEAEEE